LLQGFLGFGALGGAGGLALSLGARSGRGCVLRGFAGLGQLALLVFSLQFGALRGALGLALSLGAGGGGSLLGNGFGGLCAKSEHGGGEGDGRKQTDVHVARAPVMVWALCR